MSVWVLLFLVALSSGCTNLTLREAAQQMTDRIRHDINGKGWGNSYDVVDQVAARCDRTQELLDHGVSRAEVATMLGLSEAAKKVYFDFGIVVEGAARDEDLEYLHRFLSRIPPHHLTGMRAVVMGVNYSRFYDRNSKGRYYPFVGGVISFIYNQFGEEEGKVIRASLAHELGHHVQWYIEGWWSNKVFWMYHLLFSWGDDAYESEYAQKNHWEEYAEIYEDWVDNSLTLLSGLKNENGEIKSSIRVEKTLKVVRQFLFLRDGKYFLRVYKEDKFEDLEFDLESPESFDADHLFAVQIRTTLACLDLPQLNPPAAVEYAL